MRRANGNAVIAIACGLWLTLMIGIRYFSYEYKSPVRIF